jgi:hypothetical protein
MYVARNVLDENTLTRGISENIEGTRFRILGRRRYV